MNIKSLFEIGSWVVYPSHGVGRLESIEHIDINGEDLEFFVILFPKNKLTLKLPIIKAVNSGLRQVANKEALEQVFAILSQRIKKRRVMWSKRAQEYEVKINSGNPVALAEVLRELYKAGGDIMQSFSERQIYHQALERLVTEISIVEDINEEDAIKKVETLLQAA